jgi:hypothetical protein
MDTQTNDEQLKAVIAKTAGRPCKCMSGNFNVPDGATGTVSLREMAVLHGAQSAVVHFYWEQPDKSKKRCLVDYFCMELSSQDEIRIKELSKTLRKAKDLKEVQQLKPEPKFKPMSAIANFDKAVGHYIIAAVEKTKDGFNLQVLCMDKGQASTKPNVGEQAMAFDKQEAAEKTIKVFGLEPSATMNVVVLKVAKVIV